jgi:hypothetical protein
LENKIKEEKQVAQQFLAAGNKEAARLALTRARIMEKELTEEDE